MNIEIKARGLGAKRTRAIKAGLAAMDVHEASVIVAEDFAAEIRRRDDNPDYDLQRGANIVAARTLDTPTGPLLVFNPAVRAMPLPLLERFAAHEGGHARIYQRRETSSSREHLVHGNRWQWELLRLGQHAVDEFRIERALAELGYPIAETATNECIDIAVNQLNDEVLSALWDPASQDPAVLRDRILNTQSWLSQQLAYLAAYRRDEKIDLAALSARGQRNWTDYISGHWALRVAGYTEIPDARVELTDSELERVLLVGLDVETDLLRHLGFLGRQEGVIGEFRLTATPLRIMQRRSRGTAA